MFRKVTINLLYYHQAKSIINRSLKYNFLRLNLNFFKNNVYLVQRTQNLVQFFEIIIV